MPIPSTRRRPKLAKPAVTFVAAKPPDGAEQGPEEVWAFASRTHDAEVRLRRVTDKSRVVGVVFPHPSKQTTVYLPAGEGEGEGDDAVRQALSVYGASVGSPYRWIYNHGGALVLAPGEARPSAARRLASEKKSLAEDLARAQGARDEARARAAAAEKARDEAVAAQSEAMTALAVLETKVTARRDSRACRLTLSESERVARVQSALKKIADTAEVTPLPSTGKMGAGSRVRTITLDELDTGDVDVTQELLHQTVERLARRPFAIAVPAWVPGTNGMRPAVTLLAYAFGVRNCYGADGVLG